MELSTNITQAWDDLFMESRRVDASLVSVKKKFTEVSILNCVKDSLWWLYASLRTVARSKDSEWPFCLAFQPDVKYRLVIQIGVFYRKV